MRYEIKNEKMTENKKIKFKFVLFSKIFLILKKLAPAKAGIDK